MKTMQRSVIAVAVCFAFILAAGTALAQDADGDGYSDAIEVSSGSDPLDAAIFPRIVEAGKGSDSRVSREAHLSVNPDIAWSGSEYGLAWQDGRASGAYAYEIFFARYSALGTKIGVDYQLTSTGSYAGWPSLVWSGTEFGVAWNTFDIYFSRLGANGVKIGGDVQVTSSTGTQRDASLVHTGSEYGLVWYDTRDGSYGEIYFVRLAADGAKIGAEARITFDLRESDQPSLCWTGTEFGLAWQDRRSLDYEIYFTRVSAAGVKIGGDVRLTSSSGLASDPSLAWAGGEFGVAWSDERGALPGEIYFTRVSAAGAEIGNDIRITSLPYASASPSLIWTGSEFGLTWADRADGNEEIYFTRISGQGAAVSPMVRVTQNSNVSRIPQSAWSGSEFGIVWQDHRDSNWEVYFSRVAYDNDGDGLDNVKETDNGSDPQDWDTDGDAMSDGWEIDNSACMEVLAADTASGDYDGDGLSNLQEYTLRSGPCETDTDHDGYGDGLDCGPADPDIHPGAVEICDGKDNQCPGDAGYGFADGNCGCAGPGDEVMSVWPGGENPDLDADLSGTAYLAWKASGNIYVRRFDLQGDTLGAELHAGDTLLATWEGNPAVASLPGGDFVAVWEDTDTMDAFYRRFDRFGVALTPIIHVSGSTLSMPSPQPRVAVNHNGVLMLAWLDEDPAGGGGQSVFFHLYNADGNTMTPRLRADQPGDPYAFNIAAGPDGRFVVAWRDSGGGDLMMSRVREDGSVSSPPVNVVHYPQPLLGEFGLAVSAGGEMAIVLTYGVANEQDVYAVCLDAAGDTAGAPRLLSAAGSVNPINVTVAADANGVFHAAWQDALAVNPSIWGTRFGCPAPLPPKPYQLAAGGSYPALAADPGGNILLAYQDDGIYLVRPRMDEDCDGIPDLNEDHSCTDRINPDTDRDGLCDGGRALYDGPALVCSAGEDLDGDAFVDGGETDACEDDSDGDGFGDGFEFSVLRTDPLLVDSDGDGLTEAEEINLYGTNPALYDSDGDGISDYDELMFYLTDPWDVDTDGDGLPDQSEVLVSLTDPADPDSDDDGIPDGSEEGIGVGDPDHDGIPNSWESVYPCMNPGLNDAAGDYDGDGSNNLWEYRTGMNPCHPDTDGDGLCDRWIAVGSTCSSGESNWGTRPTNPDTDGDGLSDGEEAITHGTDPLDPDSDNDGYSDGAEISAGSDPNDPGSIPAQPVHLINYQGRLADSSGVAINGPVPMTFSLFGALSGGTAMWTEPQTVTVNGGIYNVLLGSATPFPTGIFDTQPLYLEVAVNSETLSPRALISAVPFAIKAEELLGGRIEMDNRALNIGAPAAQVTLHVAFNQAFTAPPKVVLSPLDNEIGGTSFVATKVSNITAYGFDVTFESKTGAAAAGSAVFTYQAFGK